MNWTDLWSALALCLIIEGLLPFAAPLKAKQYFTLLAILPARVLQRLGAMLIIAGMLTLYLIR